MDAFLKGYQQVLLIKIYVHINIKGFNLFSLIIKIYFSVMVLTFQQLIVK